MNSPPSKSRIGGNLILSIYLLIVVAALAFDLTGDRSFGALMLAAIPVSMISMACLFVGPWLARAPSQAALKHWLVGVGLVLVITLVFISLGVEQAKAGELVFTYAVFIMALPASLILPFAMIWSEPYIGSSVMSRVVFAWIICVMAGGGEWWVLRRLRESISRRHGHLP